MTVNLWNGDLYQMSSGSDRVRLSSLHRLTPSLGAVPGAVRRQALWWARAMCGQPQGLQQVYDSASARLELPGVRLQWPWHAVMYAINMIHKSDNDILQTCSTSPDAEMPGFSDGAIADPSCGC